MPILEPRKPIPAAVHAVREVRVGIAFERRDAIMRFYTETVGLPAWPAARQFPGGWGAGHPSRGVFFGYRHDARERTLCRRFVVRVQRLGEVLERLRAADCWWEHRRGFGPCDESVLVTDPAGHMVELREQRLF